MTDSEGMIWQSYRYNANGDITFGKPQYNNVYSYNAESYNPNMESQYLRARYYNVTHANFLTEDSYLGNITDPLTLNRYNYVKSSPLNYVDPSGHDSRYGVGAPQNMTDPYASTNSGNKELDLMNLGTNFGEKLASVGRLIKTKYKNIKDAVVDYINKEHTFSMTSDEYRIDVSMEKANNASEVTACDMYETVSQLFDGILDSTSNTDTLPGQGENFIEIKQVVMDSAIAPEISDQLNVAKATAAPMAIYALVEIIKELIVALGGITALPGAAIAVIGGVVLGVGIVVTVSLIESKVESKKKTADEVIEDETKGDSEADDYYKKGRPEGGNPSEDTLLRKNKADIKSEDFKEFLEDKGQTPSKWKKVMETWETPDGDVYERHYWTNGTDSYYHD